MPLNPTLGNNSPMALRVLILEDDPFTRISVAAAVRQFGHEVVVEEEATGVAVKKAATLRPDVAVLDLHLGVGPTGLDVAVALRKLNSRIGIVMLTSYEDPRLLGPSTPKVPEGTVYLTKGEVKNLNAIRGAIELAVDRPKPPSVISNERSLSGLTDTQVETLRLVAKGLSNAEIAKRKFLTERSVGVAISRIAKVLGLEYSSDQNLRVKLAREYFKSIGANEVASEG